MVEDGTVDAVQKGQIARSLAAPSMGLNILNIFDALGDRERVRFGTEVDGPAYAAHFAADGASAQLVNESESGLT